MKKMLITFLIIALVFIVWIVKANKAQAVQNSSYKHLWFAAVKHESAHSAFSTAKGVEIPWQVTGDLAFIAQEGTEPYWNTMLLLGSNDALEAPLLFNDDVTDAYLVVLQPYEAPALVLSAFSLMHKIGLWKKPPNQASMDVDTSLIRADIGPSKAAIEALFDLPKERKPMMVNFLKFYETAQYPDDGVESRPDVTGRTAYDRYGNIANTTVYGLGGEYVLGGYIKEVLRPAQNGPSVGEWDDIAVMQYPDQTAILTMDQVQNYRDALRHRNAGLERTVIISATR